MQGLGQAVLLSKPPSISHQTRCRLEPPRKPGNREISDRGRTEHISAEDLGSVWCLAGDSKAIQKGAAASHSLIF